MFNPADTEATQRQLMEEFDGIASVLKSKFRKFVGFFPSYVFLRLISYKRELTFTTMAGLEKMNSHLATILDLAEQEQGFTKHRKDEIVRIYHVEDTNHNADTILLSLVMALTPNYS